jgi:acyl-CoA thioesterase
VSALASSFERASAVAPLGDGAFSATCDPAWWTPRGPNGGYLAAIVLRAMTAGLGDPAREARSLTCHYLLPPAEGEMRIDVTVERAGRSLSTVSARQTQEGRLCVLAVGAFALAFGSAVDYAPSAPPAPPVEDVPRLPPFPEVPISSQFDVWPTLGAAPFSSADEAVTGGWLRFADPQALDAPALAMFADGWLPAPFLLVTEPVGAPTIDLTVHFRAPAVAAAIAPEKPVLAVFRSSMSRDGFFEEDGELWSADGVLLAQSRQLALLLGNRG